MPEGHSLRRLALAFEDGFVGHVCELSSPQGRFTAGAQLLSGRRMTRAESVGKHLFLGFEDTAAPLWLHTHLGLYGAWRFSGVQADTIGAPRVTSEETPAAGEAPPPRGAVRVRILTDTAVADLSGPNTCEVLSDDEKARLVAKLGPDPLGEDARNPAVRNEFVQLVRGSGRPVGDLVMDQSISAGVGNIYRAEALFREGISPRRAGRRVSAARLGRLWDTFVTLLERGVEEGKINTVEPEDQLFSEADPEASHWYVYHRTGRPCLKCGTPIREADMKGRRLFWCPTCQT